MILPFISGIIQGNLGGAVLCLRFTVSSIRWMAWKLRLLNDLLAVSYIVKYLKIPGVILCVIAMLVIPQIQYAKSDKEKYFTVGQKDDEY